MRLSQLVFHSRGVRDDKKNNTPFIMLLFFFFFCKDEIENDYGKD